MIKHILVILLAGLMVVVPMSVTLAQEKTIEPSYQVTPTVFGGSSTGLFNTLGTRTLKTGELTFGVFWNNYDRDPGDLDINQIPINFTLGLNDRWEVFANVDVFQQVTSTPSAVLGLSGPQFNGRRSQFGGNPIAAFGPSVGGRGDDAAAFFVNSGSRVGGILPPPGFIFGQLVANRPSFYNELPFFGQAYFNPRTGAYEVSTSGNGLGNITAGTKVNLLHADRRFSLAVAGLFRFSSTNNFHGLANGRGHGEIDYGPMVILGQSFAGHRVRFSENIGYIRSGDPDRNNIKLLDRRDQLLLNGGVEIAPAQKVVLTGEVNSTVYVGSGTPNLNPINPVDLIVGLRYFAWNGKFELGGGYRRLLNGAEGRTMPGIPPGRTTLGPVAIGSDDVNGFVFNVAFGRRKEVTPPPPPNRPPSVFLEANPSTIRPGERATVTARAMDPDNDVLDYSWLASAGQIIGSGPSVIFDATGLAPGEYTVSVTVDDKKGGTASNSVTIRVIEPPPPPPPVNRAPSIRSINCNTVIGTALVPGQITDGETVRVSAVASDPDGDRLTYRWSTTAGQIRGSGSDVTLDTTGVTAGPGAPPVEITITLTVSDDKGLTDTSTCRLTVRSVKKPEAEKVQMHLEFPARSARVNNVHKAILDDIALRLQQEPDARLLIYGYANKGERPRLAQQRANNVVNYLVREKGIQQERLLIRTVVATVSDPANRRVEMWIVPSGAELPQ